MSGKVIGTEKVLQVHPRTLGWFILDMVLFLVMSGTPSLHALGRKGHDGSENEAALSRPFFDFSIGCPEEHRTCRQQRAAKPAGQPCLVAWKLSLEEVCHLHHL